MIISDDHLGLEAARRAVFGGVPWQRCQFHLQRNAGSYVTRQEMHKEVGADIRTIFNAPDLHTAQVFLEVIVKKYEKTASKLADWLENNLPERFAVFNFPVEHRRKIRTTNGLEHLIREIRRRIRVVSIFPNEASCLRLISAVLMEIDEEWQTGRTYLTIRVDASPPL